MIKLRVRLQKKTSVILVPKENGSECCLNDIREEIRKQLNIDHFELSLNGKDTLPRENVPLKELGIVSGDLVHVLLTQNDHAVVSTGMSAEYQAKKPNTERVVEEKKNTEEQSVKQSYAQDTGQSSSSRQVPSTEDDDYVQYEDEDVVMDVEVNKYLSEPMVIRECTVEAVPSILETCFQNTSLKDSHDAVFLVLHLLMLETGFQVKGSREKYLPDGWKQDGGIKKVLYQCSDETNKSQITLLYIILGNMAKVHCTVENSSVPHSCILKCEDYVSHLTSDAVSTYKNLPKLSRIFKDKVSYPVLQSLHGDTVPNLLNLTAELQLMVFKHLNALELVRFGRVCKQCLEVSKDIMLWRRLYLKNFGKRREGNELNRDWKILYKEKYVERERRRQQQREYMRLHYPRPQVPRHEGPYPWAPMFPPGAIGGDFDREPFFGGVHPAFGQGPIPPIVPRPRFDPVGPLLPDQRFMRPGRGGGIWEAPDGGGGGMFNVNNHGGRRLGGGFGGGPRFF